MMFVRSAQALLRELHLLVQLAWRLCAGGHIANRIACAADGAGHPPQAGAWRRPCLWRLFVMLMVGGLLLARPAMAATPPGTVIPSTASGSFTYLGNAVSVSSNTVNVVTTILRTPSAIALYQYAPGHADITVTVPSQYISGGPGGAPVASPNPQVPQIGGGVVTLDPNTPQPLAIASEYTTGSPVFVQVSDGDQNLDPTVRETVRVVITSSTGDQEELVLTETAANSGQFIAYVQSTGAAVSQYDGLMSLGEDTRLTVQYVDATDASDVSTTVSLVDPFGVVFSSFDGSVVDGAIVALVDSNGQPVPVFGDDGVSTYSNPVVSGSSVTDSSGKVYNFPSGGFRFPRVAPGNYRLLITAPQGFTAPSQVAEAALQNLSGAPFALDANGSYGRAFNLLAGPPLHIDVPVDPLSSNLVIEKSVSKETAAIGDFVQYTLKLSNIDANASATQITITDKLPPGLRYQQGSASYDGVIGAEPVVSNDGRTLRFSLPSLAPNASAQIKYVTEITVGARPGRAVNSAYAVDAMNIRSNTAQAAITVTEDLYASRSFIAGRVIVGECDEDGAIIHPGLGAVRLFMEDGTYTATDESGRYHFEGIQPGVHVVQLDKESLPDNLEVIDCERNTRHAGTPYSQFVDFKGGTLWRVDFFVREKPPVTDTTSLYIQSELSAENIKYRIEMQNGAIPVDNYRLVVNLPKGIEYVPGSSALDGVAIDNPYVNDGVLVYRLGKLGGNWKKSLSFRGRIHDKADGELVTTALVLLDTDVKKNMRSKPVKNTLAVKRVRAEKQTLVYEAFFEPMSAELSVASKRAIRAAIAGLGDVEIRRSEVHGYADARPIKPRSLWLYTDNTELSKARAKAVSDFLVKELHIDPATVVIQPRGVDKTARTVISKQAAHSSGDKVAAVQAMSLQRRAELVVNTSKIVKPGDVKLVTSKSDVSKLTLQGQPPRAEEKLIEAPKVPAQRDISEFDEFWIKKQKPGYAWLLPDEGFAPAQASVNLAIKHRPGDHYELLHNGRPINPLFFFGSIQNKKGTVARSYWQGVHLEDGHNVFEFIVRDKQGRVARHLKRDIVFAGVPVRAELDEKYSRLIADGRHLPVIALRVYDKDGLPARPGSRGRFKVMPPFIPQQEIEAYQNNRLSGRHREDPEYVVGANGLAYIVLEPTTQTGKVEIDLPFTGRKKSRIQTWLKPEVRDWILVGLAQGTIGYNSVSGNMEALDKSDVEDAFYDNGRIAFYAKGKVKGEWLLTAAYDSAKKTVAGDRRLNQLIDPNTYYTIYGDNTRQRHDASSADKLYVKLEREQFYALYGDMDTGLTVTDLSRFSRRMTGLKSEGNFENLSFTAFAAENRNNFIKDEIQGEGISGLYRLSGKNIVINSDKIVIETRDRFRSEIIVKTETLHRYIDYNIDYHDGTLYFRKPIPSRDENFNPVFIVADYEVETPVTGDMTAGGRVAGHFNNNRIEVGATAIRDGSYLAKGNLLGADARIELDKQTELRLEAATTDVDQNGNKKRGNALSAEIVHGGDRLKTRAYYKQQDVDFGLGQQSISQSGTRKLGMEGDYRIDDRLGADARIYHEEVLATEAKRDVAEGNVRYGTHQYAVNAGLRIAHDLDAIGQVNDSNLLLLGASRNFLDNMLTLRGNAEIAVGGSNANPDYPSRYILGADYFVTPKVNLFAENEWTDGRDQNTMMTRAGVRSTPWTGAQVNTAVNQETNENGVRAFATMGLTQSFPITKRLSGDIAFDQAKTLRQPGARPFNPNVPIAQGTDNNDFVAVSFGTTYQAESYTLNNRIEVRNAQTDHKIGLVANWERFLLHGIGYSAGLKLFNTDRNDGSRLFEGDARLSLAYRPLHSRWIILNRFDYVFDSSTDVFGIKTRQRKLIENFASNYLLDSRNQIAFNGGLKYVVDTFDKLEYSGLTWLLGSEYRHDISDRFDLGVHANVYHSVNSDLFRYSRGVSLGWNVKRNIWLSVGYNFTGFEDNDFSAAGYSASGPYIRFRMKFDQDTAKAVRDWLN